MPKFVDVYLIPINEENIPAYREIAEEAGRVFRKHGVLKYREYVGADLSVKDVVPFTSIIKTEPGETIVYAAVEFESREHRDETMAKIMADPELTASMEGKEPPFDYKKMVYGGFEVMVDL